MTNPAADVERAYKGWTANLLTAVQSLNNAGQSEGALRLIEMAPQGGAEDAGFQYAKGQALSNLGRVKEALATFEHVLALEPDNPFYRTNIAFAWLNRQNMVEPVRILEPLLNYPDDYYAKDAGRVRCYCLQTGPEWTSARQTEETRNWAAKFITPRLTPKSERPLRKDFSFPIRVGYLHTLFDYPAYDKALVPLFENHDPSVVQIYGYSTASTDWVNPRIRKAAHQWRRLTGLSPEEARNVILADEIDILVDLDGYALPTPTDLFVLRPAPIMATWINSLNTFGSTIFDYLIADPVCLPLGEEAAFSERVLRLPHSFLHMVPVEPIPDVAPPPVERNGVITFGSFNRPDKFHAAVAASWARIVNATPGSRLRLRHSAYGDAYMQGFVSDTLTAAGLDPSRVDFIGGAAYVSQWEFLESYGELDIALDTFPFNGATTTIEALHQGVPVVTFPAGRWAGRIGQALLTAAGLPELVAPDQASFERLAIELAADRPRLAELRRTIRPRVQASPLSDMTGFTRAMERLYVQMVEERLAEEGRR